MVMVVMVLAGLLLLVASWSRGSGGRRWEEAHSPLHALLLHARARAAWATLIGSIWFCRCKRI